MIEARGLTKRFGDVVAVDDLSFDVVPGEVTGFLGPNGSGKSTTMRLILGLDLPNDGAVSVLGRPYRELRWPLREVGALLEARAIHPGRSAYSHLLMLARANRIPRGRVDEVLGLVGLADVAGKRAGKYSLGMGQRLGIAGALLGDPGVLLFDEPVNGLDPEGIQWVRNLLKRLAGEGRTVFVSSHLMNEMAVTANRVVVIGRGRLLAQGPVSELLVAASGQRTLVRSPGLGVLASALEGAGAKVEHQPGGAAMVSGVATEQVGELAAKAGVVLHELTPQVASLEEAFMELTKEEVQFRAEPGQAAPGSPATGTGEHREVRP